MTSGMLVRQILAGGEQRRLARTDPMTGLANRAAIAAAVEGALARSARTASPRPSSSSTWTASSR